MRHLIALFFLILASCSPKSDSASPDTYGDLSFDSKTLTKEVCVDEDCAQLQMVWPEASGTAQAEKINIAIQEHLTHLIQTGESTGTLDSLAMEYFESFEAFKTEFPDSPGGWEIEVEGKVTYESDSTLSIYFTQSSFLGGAHPNSTVSFLNFEKQSGEYLSKDRLVYNEMKLLQLAEQKFRAFHEVEEGKSLKDDGRFFLPETGFFLANAMGFRDGKFWIIYVPYEIGPYVMGYTELEFSPEDLKGIVRW